MSTEHSPTRDISPAREPLNAGYGDGWISGGRAATRRAARRNNILMAWFALVGLCACAWLLTHSERTVARPWDNGQIEVLHSSWWGLHKDAPQFFQWVPPSRYPVE